MTLKEIRQALAAKKTAARALLAEFNTLGAVAAPTADQTARIAALDTQLTALETEIEDLQARLDAEEAKVRRTALFTGARTVNAGEAARVNEPDPIRTHGFKSVVEFAHAVRSAQVINRMDERLNGPIIEGALPASYQQNQGASGEGFLVPPEYSKTVWDLALDDNDLLGMTQPEPTESNAVAKPKDETTPWGSAGVQSYWGAESGLYTPSQAKITAELMTLHKLFAFVPATDEILADAPMLRNRITLQAGRAIRFKASDAIMFGTGAGQPMGYMNSPALVTVAKDAGQAAKTISVSNLSNMLAHALRNGSKPIWLANQDVLPQLIGLTIGNYPVWIPISGGLQDSPFDGYIFGYPVMFTEHAQTLGTLGDITIFNPEGYYSATKAGGIDFAESMHLYFDQGLTAFRWTFRLTGMPYLSAPVQPAKGATAKSHFVALATRA